jgi:hypothetical protein
MSLDELVPLVAGPFGAIVTCLLVGIGIYRLMVYMFVPMLQRSIDRHFEQVDELNARNHAEHQRIMDRLDASIAQSKCTYSEAAK